MEQKNDIQQKELQIGVTKKMLDVIMLMFLRKRSRHGYELMSKIQKTFGVHFRASTIYPTLAELQRNGLVVSQWDTEKIRPRKVYSLTDKGQEALTDAIDSFSIFYQKILDNQLTIEE